MLVVFSEKIPPAVRGKLKLWMIEPVPNVFISSVSDYLAEQVAEKLFASCPDDASLIIVRSTSAAPGYALMQKSGKDAAEKLISLNGLQLVRRDGVPVPKKSEHGDSSADHGEKTE